MENNTWWCCGVERSTSSSCNCGEQYDNELFENLDKYFKDMPAEDAEGDNNG